MTGAAGLRAIVLGTGASPERIRFYAESLQIEPVTDGTQHSFDLGPGGPEAEALAELIMQAHGVLSAAVVRRRLGALRVLAASRVRAMTPAPRRLRAGTGDFVVTHRSQPHAGFLGLEVLTLTHSRFDGTTSPPIIREVMLSGDAVTVLPYDPVRDRVLLIEQMRAGPLGRGDPLPWQLEAIAGRIDPGETPEDAARREAVEEAGLNLGKLHKVAEYYPTPGAMAEYLYSYVAICDLPAPPSPATSCRPGGSLIHARPSARSF